MHRDWIDLDAEDLDTELAQAIEEEELESLSPNGYPLEMLLVMFINAPSEVRQNYYAGFKRLHNWLKPIALPTVPERRVPYYLDNWEVQELAQIIGCSPSVIWYTFMKIFNSQPYEDKANANR